MPDLGLNHRGPNGLPPVLILPQSKYTGAQGKTARLSMWPWAPGQARGTNISSVIPAKAGIQNSGSGLDGPRYCVERTEELPATERSERLDWIPAFAGMTSLWKSWGYAPRRQIIWNWPELWKCL